MAASTSAMALAARPTLAVRSSRSAGRALLAAPLRPARAMRARRAAPAPRAAGDDEPLSLDAEALKETAAKLARSASTKWEETEEKPAAIALTVAGFVAVWASAGLIDAVDSLPVIGDFFELVGLFVTAWFVYRYLIFGPDRAELMTNIEGFFLKVQGK